MLSSCVLFLCSIPVFCSLPMFSSSVLSLCFPWLTVFSSCVLFLCSLCVFCHSVLLFPPWPYTAAITSYWMITTLRSLPVSDWPNWKRRSRRLSVWILMLWDGKHLNYAGAKHSRQLLMCTVWACFSWKWFQVSIIISISDTPHTLSKAEMEDILTYHVAISAFHSFAICSICRLLLSWKWYICSV